VTTSYISDLAWSRLGVEPAKLSENAVDREVFQVLLGLLPSRLYPTKSGHETELKKNEEYFPPSTNFVFALAAKASLVFHTKLLKWDMNVKTFLLQYHVSIFCLSHTSNCQKLPSIPVVTSSNA